MAPLSFLFVALALASMHGALGAPSRKHKWDGSPPATQPMPTSTPSVAPSSSLPQGASSDLSGLSGGPVSETDIQTYLDAHNEIRSLHGAKPLTWSNELSFMAQASAGQCGSYEYSNGGTYLLFGGSFLPKARVENDVARPGPFTIRDAVALWGSESGTSIVPTMRHDSRIDPKCYIVFYNPSNPGSSASSFFTQVVWKATTEVGCASAVCTDGVIRPLEDGVRPNSLSLTVWRR